jgi:GT2 family glycosyltransferase
METERVNMYSQNHKIDVIVPTAHAERWPAIDSIRWNKATARFNWGDVNFYPIESSGKDFSFSKSVNQGLCLSDIENGSDVFLLNDDCFLDPFWANLLYSAKICHPECGIFGALLRFPVYEDGLHAGYLSGRNALNHWKPKYQHAGGYIPLTAKDQLYGLVRFGFWNLAPFFVIRQMVKTREMGFRFPGHYHNLNPNNKIHLITAAAMLITSDAFSKLGFFDEDLPLSFNDTDYSLRALENNIGLCLVNDCTGAHYESLSTKYLEYFKRKDYQTFYNKWPEERLKKVIRKDNTAIVHPKFCGCEDWNNES